MLPGLYLANRKEAAPRVHTQPSAPQTGVSTGSSNQPA